MNKGTRVARDHRRARTCWARQASASASSSSSAISARSSTTSSRRAELVARRDPDDIGVSVSYPLPGTKFYELVKAQLGAKTHWQDSNDLAMMFHGTYDSDFYRQVRNLLHEQVLRQQSAPADRPEPRQQASAALDARWDELIASEHLHRSEPATPTPTTVSADNRLLRHAATAHHR